MSYLELDKQKQILNNKSWSPLEDIPLWLQNIGNQIGKTIGNIPSGLEYGWKNTLALLQARQEEENRKMQENALWELSKRALPPLAIGEAIVQSGFRNPFATPEPKQLPNGNYNEADVWNKIQAQQEQSNITQNPISAGANLSPFLLGGTPAPMIQAGQVALSQIPKVGTALNTAVNLGTMADTSMGITPDYISKGMSAFSRKANLDKFMESAFKSGDSVEDVARKLTYAKVKPDDAIQIASDFASKLNTPSMSNAERMAQFEKGRVKPIEAPVENIIKPNIENVTPKELDDILSRVSGLPEESNIRWAVAHKQNSMGIPVVVAPDILKKFPDLSYYVSKTPTKPIETPPASLGGQVPPVKPVQEIPQGMRESRYFKRVNEQLNNELGDNPLYKQANLANETEKAINFVEKNTDDARKIALGYKNPPNDSLGNSIATAYREKMLQNGDISEYTQTLTNQSLRSTRMGQEIASLKGTVNDNSPTHFVQKVIAQRMENVGSKIPKTTGQPTANASKVTQQIDREVEQLKKIANYKKVDLQAAQSLIDSLICK
jgi:hypothetical protein